MSNNILKRKEELRVAYEMARSGKYKNAKVIRTLTEDYVRKYLCGPNKDGSYVGYEEVLNTDQDYKAFALQYDPAITASVKVVGTYHGCNIVLHIHR